MASGLIQFSTGVGPLFVDNLVAWWTAGSVLGVANNANVSSWTDSKSGLVASQATGANQPVFTANRANYRPSIKFGGNAVLTVDSPGILKTTIDSGNYTVFIVFKTLGVAANGYGGLFTSFASSAGLMYFANGTHVGIFGVGNNIPYADQTSFSTFGSCAWESSLFGLDHQHICINGGSVDSLSSSPKVSGTSTFSIGSDAANDYPVNAEIFDILVWNVPLTPPQYKAVQMWADNRYGQEHPWAALSAYNVFFGDSQTQGAGVSNATHKAPYVAAESLGLLFGQWDSLGVGGISAANMDALAPSWIDTLPADMGLPINLIGFEWYNQRGVDPIPYNKSKTYLANRKLVSNLNTVWGTSIDNSTDSADETNRSAYNSSFDAAHLNVDSYMDLHASTLIGSSTAYSNHSAEYWADGLHLNQAGQAVLAGLFVTGIQALP